MKKLFLLLTLLIIQFTLNAQSTNIFYKAYKFAAPNTNNIIIPAGTYNYSVYGIMGMGKNNNGAGIRYSYSMNNVVGPAIDINYIDKRLTYGSVSFQARTTAGPYISPYISQGAGLTFGQNNNKGVSSQTGTGFDCRIPDFYIGRVNIKGITFNTEFQLMSGTAEKRMLVGFTKSF